MSKQKWNLIILCETLNATVKSPPINSSHHLAFSPFILRNWFNFFFNSAKVFDTWWPVNSWERTEKCIFCTRTFTKPIIQIMSDLLASRIIPIESFQHLGIGYNGSIYSMRKKSSTFKLHICIFVYFCTNETRVNHENASVNFKTLYNPSRLSLWRLFRQSSRLPICLLWVNGPLPKDVLMSNNWFNSVVINGSTKDALLFIIFKILHIFAFRLCSCIFILVWYYVFTRNPNDCYGRSFIGASSYIKTLNQLSQNVTVQNYSSNLRKEWHLILPYGSRFGGLRILNQFS